MSEIHDEVVERLRQHGEAIASDRDRLFKELTEARARIAELERMGAPGQLTGMKDKHGTEIRIGDTLRFDFNEWNRSELNMARWCGREPDPAKLEECVFVMEYKDGALCHPGGTYELDTYCEIIEKVKP